MGGSGAGDGGRIPKWVTAVVLLLPLVLFSPSIGNGYAMDDEHLAASWSKRHPDRPDPVIAELHGPGFYFDKFYWFSEYINDGLYRPVTIYSYALTYNLIGRHLSPESEAVPHHVINVLLHVFATLLVLWLLLRLSVSPLAAHVGAGLFGVHAIHSEVVAGVVGRAELFAFCFGLAAILLFLRSTVARGGHRTAFVAVAAVLMFCAYCSKESAVACCPFLFCLLLADRWVRGTDQTPVAGPLPGSLPGSLLRGAVVAVVPLVVFLLMREQVMAKWTRVELIDYVANPLYLADTTTRLYTALKVWGYGLYKCVAPFHLSANYGAAVFTLASSFVSFAVLGSIAVLGAMLFVGLRYARCCPPLFIGVACFLGFSFVTSNIPFAVGTMFAERLYYMPSMGICVLVAFVLDRARTHLGVQRILLGVCVAWGLCSSVVAWQRNGVWRDSASLFLAEAENQPRSADMSVKAAQVLRFRLADDAENGAKALVYLTRALDLVEGYPHALREKAALHVQRQEWDAALDAYQQAIRSEYPELKDAKAISWNGLAGIWLMQGKTEKAVEAATRSLEAAPLNSDGWLMIADKGPGILPDAKMRDFFTRGRLAILSEPDVIGEAVTAPVMALYVGVMGERVGADPKAVFELLEYGARNTSADWRPPDLFVEALFSMGKAKARAGEPAVARKLFGDLLNNDKLPAELRRRIVAARDGLPKN